LHTPKEFLQQLVLRSLEIAASEIEFYLNTMGLLRYQIFLAIGVSFLSIWFALINGDSTSNPLVLYAPVWLIVLLGLYAIGSIVSGLMSFKDTPEAAAEIERQILEAKAEMKKRGVLKD